MPRAPYPSNFAAFVVVVELRPVDAKNSHGCFLFSVALQHKRYGRLQTYLLLKLREYLDRLEL